jgi:hypothetical protein
MSFHGHDSLLREFFHFIAGKHNVWISAADMKARESDPLPNLTPATDYSVRLLAATAKIYKPDDAVTVAINLGD